MSELGTFGWALRRDLGLALRRPSDALNVLGFFVLACSMFPLAVGPQREWLTRVFDELLWVFVFREGPMTREAWLERAGGSSPAASEPGSASYSASWRPISAAGSTPLSAASATS